MSRIPGRSFYAAPGPTNIPDSVLQACAQATTDFAGPGFAPVYAACLEGLRQVLGTGQDFFFYACSGHGAWEATLANLFSPGETVLMLESGVFSGFWAGIATALGLQVQTVGADWRRGVAMADVAAALRADTSHRIAAVCVVHNDTASGVTLPASEVRAALDAAGHPALFVLDTISSAGSLPLALDDWGVDAAVGSCQKGLMLPPGLAFTAVGPKALGKHRRALLPRAYFDWSRMRGRPHPHSAGTISAAMFAGLRQSLGLIAVEGLPAVLARHARLAAAVRAAIHAWGGDGHGPELYCLETTRVSDSVSSILLPPGFAATPIRRLAAERFHVTLGGDLGLFGDRLFRIGHMGDLNEAMVLGVLGVVELCLAANGVPFQTGLAAAMAALK